MAYEAQYRNFARDKRSFFADVKTTQEARERAKNIEHNYVFLSSNQMLIEQEVNQLKQLCNGLKDDSINRDAVLLYYYYCIMLQNLYRAYGKTAKVEEFTKLKKQIRRHFDKVKVEEPEKPVNNDSFLLYLAKSIGLHLADLVKTPWHVSKIRDQVSFANIYRIYWYFCRTTITNSFLLARDLNWIDRLNSEFGRHINVDNIINTLEKPNAALRGFSVEFFAIRFFLDLLMIIKHVYFPSEAEKDGYDLELMSNQKVRKNKLYVELIDGSFLKYKVIGLDGKLKEDQINCNEISNLQIPNPITLKWLNEKDVKAAILEITSAKGHTQSEAEKDRKSKMQRAYDEFYKRHADLLNNFVWGSVNLLTNYNKIFHIAAPTAGWIVAGFLVFDVLLILWRRHLAEREYLIKRAQYKSDIAHFNKLLRNPDLEDTERLRIEALCELTHEQKELLDISWQAKNATYWFNASAALLLMVGFSASMVLSPPIAILACYALCTVAVAMYLSDSAYHNYKEKSLLLEHNYTAKAMQEYKDARNAFYLTMAKNVIMPTLFIATFAICWQAALVLTALYMGYQLYNAYCKYEESKAKQENIGIIGVQDKEKQEQTLLDQEKELPPTSYSFA